MTKAPKRIAIVSLEPMCDMTGPTFDASVAVGENACGHKYTRTDLYEAAVRQRDDVIAAARKVILWAEMLEPDPPDDEPDAVDALAAVIGAIDDARSGTPPLARGDVKTGKVVRDE